MIILTGNLSERHRQLNGKVKETISNKVNFNDLKNAKEESDVDRIFKIDVASQYKNVDYIIEVLKSGDALYISRALKCTWLFQDEHSNVINPDYLHLNVFPFMSAKIKKKFLSTLPKYVTNEDRAACFFTYCMNIKLENIAYKFLIFTSEAFKIKAITENAKYVCDITYIKSDYLNHFVKESFVLADTVLEKSNPGWGSKILSEIRYLYSISDDKYLDLLEKYEKRSSLRMFQFGSRLSKDIIKKHKNRVLAMPNLYIKIVNNGILVQNITDEDAKIIIVKLLPVKDFWHSDFCNVYKRFLNVIPHEDRFDFVKCIFNTKYPDESFETNLNFYNSGAHFLMTSEQKEAWALQQVARGSEILGPGNDFRWYKFVSFEKALKEIKKYIMITPDKNKRPEILNILVESAKNQRDLEKLFCYFYDRHVNEQSYVKSNFIDRVISEHNVYEFDDNCWAAFDKLLHSLDVYDSTSGRYNCKTEHRVLAIIYHIVHKKELPDSLTSYIDSDLSLYYVKNMVSNLTEEQKENVYSNLLNFYVAKLKFIVDNEVTHEDTKFKLRRYIHNIFDLLVWQNKTKKDCPEIVFSRARLDWDEFKYHSLSREPSKPLTEADLLRCLKKEANLAIENLPAVRDRLDSTFKFNIDQLLTKLKVYFAYDVAKTYLDFIVKLLEDTSTYTIINACVHNIFQLADDTFKVNMMEKYVPNAPKIDHKAIDRKFLLTQQAICSYACVSRPPVPLKTMLKYIKGDYVKHCLPIFNSYLAHLPQPRCMEFVESLLDTPVSIQKHGLRLAFVCFNTENLVKLISSVWAKTKNVSLRSLLFKAIFNKILAAESDTQVKLYDTLEKFILNLNQDDDKELYKLIISGKLPTEFKGKAVESLWATVTKFPDRVANLECVLEVLKRIEIDMYLLRDDFIKAIVEENVKTSFKKQNVKNDTLKTKKEEIEKAKWELTAKYITLIRNDEELLSKLDLTQRIIYEYFNNWDYVESDEFIVRRRFRELTKNLSNKGYEHDVSCYSYINVVYETIMELIQENCPSLMVYLNLWSFKLNIAARKVIIAGKSLFPDVDSSKDKYEIIKDIGSQFAKEVAVIFTEFKEKNMVYTSYMEKIAAVISSNALTIRYQFYANFDYNLKQNDIVVAICVGLWMLKMPELNLLIVQLLPSDLDTYFEEDYRSLTRSLNKLDDMEIRSTFYEKFYFDFKYRTFLN